MGEGDSQCFLLLSDPDDRSRRHFELRFGADERPFHLAFRADDGTLVVNAMQTGVWGDEASRPLPAPSSGQGPVLLLRSGDRVAVFMPGLAFEAPAPGCSAGAVWPEPHADGFSVEVVPPSRAPVVDWRADAAPRLASVPVRGLGDLAVPNVPPDEAALLFEQIFRHGASWVLNLAALEPGEAPAPPAGQAETLLRDRLLAGWTPRTAAPPPARAAAPLVEGLDIVVALYNQQDYVADCVESLLAERTDEMRVLVVDDGSTDASVERLQAFGPSADGPFQILRKANGGCASARNYGRLVSNRTHLAFVDADDLTDPGFFAALWRVARATGADLVNGPFDTYAPGPPPIRKPHPVDARLIDTLPAAQAGGEPCIAFDPRLCLGVQPAVWRSVFRRAFLDRHDIWFPESLRAFDDFEFHVRCMSLAEEARLVPGRSYLYRQHPGQDVRQRDARHFANLASGAALLRSLDAGAVGATVLDVMDWSLRALPPSLMGHYGQAAAEICAAHEKRTATALSADDAAILERADMPGLFAEERARLAALAPGEWWRQAEPGLAHPGTVALALALSDLR